MKAQNLLNNAILLILLSLPSCATKDPVEIALTPIATIIYGMAYLGDVCPLNKTKQYDEETLAQD